MSLDLPAGYSLIANPLKYYENELHWLMPMAPPGTMVFKFEGTAFEEDPPVIVDGFGWFQANHDVNQYLLEPGEGVFIRLPSATKLVFVGDVLQGTLTIPIPTGFSILASKVPQAATLSELGFPAIDGDVCIRWLRAEQRYDPNAPQYFEGVGWFPEEPRIGVGESFFLFRTGPAGTWTRFFSVHP